MSGIASSRPNAKAAACAADEPPVNQSKGGLDKLFRRCRNFFETQPAKAQRGAAYYVTNHACISLHLFHCFEINLEMADRAPLIFVTLLGQDNLVNEASTHREGVGIQGRSTHRQRPRCSTFEQTHKVQHTAKTWDSMKRRM